MAEPIADTFYRKGEETKPVLGIVRQGEPEHLLALRAAFPNMWVRSDGSIHCDEFGIWWNPGDVEAVTSRAQRNEETGEIDSGGLVHIGGQDYGRGRAKLRLSQILALGAYIKAESEKANG